MSDRLALLKAILAAPDDDIPRLVFADWLEENGTSDADAARAEFIRLGCLMKAKDAITPKETKWLDANWQRLLPTATAGRPFRYRRTGRAVTLQFDAEKGRAVRFGRVVLDYVRGFVRRVGFSSVLNYSVTWPAFAADEPLAVHTPHGLADGHPHPSGGQCCRLPPRAWGGEIYSRAVGFDEESAEYGKVYRDRAEAEPDPPFLPELIDSRVSLRYARDRQRFAVATAMTARAREFVGLS